MNALVIFFLCFLAIWVIVLGVMMFVWRHEAHKWRFNYHALANETYLNVDRTSNAEFLVPPDMENIRTKRV